jgi:spermidine synthase
VKATLRDDNGLFVMHAESPISRPSAYKQILGTLGTVFAHVEVVYVYIQMYSVLWAIAIAGDKPLVAEASEALVGERLAERGIEGLQVYTPASHQAMRVEYPFISAIRATAGELPIITDSAHTFADEIDINRDERELHIAEVPIGDGSGQG